MATWNSLRFPLAALALAFGAATLAPNSWAMGTDTPPEPCKNLKKGSKKWKDCRKKAGLPLEHSEELEQSLVLGYALTKAGNHEAALKVLRPHEAAGDARVLTYIGFAERKLGRVDIALTYYTRAIAIAPNNVATLEYMGEAHLQKGDTAAARAKLHLIGTICGTNCEAYQLLSGAIAAHPI